MRVVDSVDAMVRDAARTATSEQWFRYEVEDEWTDQTAGGCFNFPSWRTNPQFELQTAEKTHAYFLLMQPDPKMSPEYDGVLGGDEGGPKYEMKIGMYVMKGNQYYRRKVLYDSEEIEGDDVVDSTPYMEYREVTLTPNPQPPTLNPNPNPNQVQANTMDE